MTPISQGVAILKTLQASASDPLGLRTKARGKPTPKPRHVRGRFLRGPFALEDFNTASCLPSKAALPVWLLIHHQCELRRQEEVTLPRALLADAGICPSAKIRALRQLEAARLITVIWAEGRSPRIRLVGE